MLRKILSRAQLLIFAGLFLISKETYSQFSFSVAPTCVVPNVLYFYSINGPINGSNVQWCVTNGSIVHNETDYSCRNAASLSAVNIRWNDNPGGSGSISVTITNAGQTINLVVNFMIPLVSGTASPVSQTIAYNTIPASVTTSAATGGWCGSTSYQYEWRSTTDFLSFSNILSTSQNYYPSSPLTVTTYFIRYVTETNGGLVGQASYPIYVMPPLQAGSLNPANQTIPTGQTASIWSIPSYGNCLGAYTYQWQSSANGTTGWTNVSGANSYNLSLPAFTTPGTYYYRQVAGCNTETVNSAVATITVYQALNPGNLSPSYQSIVSGSTAQINGPTPTGGNCGGSYTYTWAYSINSGGTFLPIAASNEDYSSGPLTQTTWFRRTVKCGTDSSYGSVYAVVNVYPVLNGGQIAPSPQGRVTITNGTSPGLLIDSISPSGGNGCTLGSYLYKWQQNTGSGYTDISATASTYTPGALTQTTSFRRRVICGTDTAYSNVVTINVAPPLVGGQITGNASTITNGTSPGIISNTVSPNGGNCGTIYYQWQQSTGAGYSDISLATGPTFTPGALLTTTFYKRKAYNSCETAYSNIVTITVAPALNPGTISGSSGPINNNTSPGTYSTQTAPSGGNCGGTYNNNMWEYSTDGINFNETGVTSSTYPSGNLLVTTTFRKRVICGTEIKYTNTITVIVNPPPGLNGGVISCTSTCISYNTSPTSITNQTFASGGSCGTSYTYQWEKNTGSGYTDIATATQNFYSPGNLTITTSFRRKANDGCVTASSNIITITVTPPLTAGSITPGHTTISNNTSPGQIDNIVFPTGGNCSPYTYQWQQSTGGVFSNVPANGNSPAYTPPNLLNSVSSVFYFKRMVSGGSETVYSNIDTIYVAPPLTAGSITGGSSTISNNTSPGQINNIVSPTGGNCPSYTYQWQQSTGGSFSDISNATVSTYSPGSLLYSISTVYYFKRKVSCGSETVYSNIDTIIVAPPLTPGTITVGSTTISNNTSPGQLNNIVFPTGGYCVSYTYQWQQSTGGVFSNITTNGNSSAYTPPNLLNSESSVFYFKRMVSCGGETVYSNIDTINVVPPVNPGLITGVISPITSGSLPGTINSSSGASGGYCDIYYSYQWQRSIDNGETYPDISLATDLSYTPGPLTQTTRFRRKVFCNYETGYSNEIIITVISALSGGTIGGNTTLIPYNTSPGTLTNVTEASGGTCIAPYNYQWLFSNDGATYSNVVSNGNNPYYTPGNLTQNTYFKRAVTCNGETVYSNVISIVIDAVLPGTITPSGITISSGTSPGLLTGNAASGGSCGNSCIGGGSYTYQWYSSPDGVNWNLISGAIYQNYDPGTLITTKYYRRVVNCNGEIRNSNTAIINVGNLITDWNYIRSRSMVKPGIVTSAAADALTNVNDVMQSTQYFDGLGRPMQTVSKQSSFLQKDVVTPIVYDEFGREAIKYLPYVSSGIDGSYKPNAIPEQRTFNTSQFATDQFFYGQTEFESSPLNRVMSNFAQGNSWVGTSRGLSNNYLVNTASEDVQIWIMDLAAGSMPFSAGAYSNGELYKSVSIDEHCKKVIEYKDKDGKVILKKVQLSSAPGIDHTGWLCTYYVYDDLNNLRFVMPPKAVEQIRAGLFWTVTQYITDELCFRYEYDTRGRMIVKKIPGAGEVWMVYDARERLVMTQDANMRSTSEKKWMVTVYENNLNRPVSTYLIADPSNYTNAAYHRNLASTSISYPAVGNYTNELLSETHYDDYTGLPNTGGLNSNLNTTYINSSNFITTYNTSPLYAQQINQSFAVKGMVTWSKVKVLGSTNAFIVSAMIYDDRSRVVQVQSINQTEGLDIVTTQYDFSGKVLRTHQKTQKLNNTVHNSEILSTPEYDHVGRIKKIKKKLTNNATVYTEKTIAENTYDELGQLKTKKLAAEYNSNAGLETQTFDYNIRGWMLGMNKSYLASQGQSGTTKFGFELGYDLLNSTSTRNFTGAQYNGNINGMVWKSDGDDVRRKYDFSYDPVNRFMKGQFEQDNGTSTWNNTVMNYTVQMGNGIDPLTAYDDNGNIKAMTQYGWRLGVSTTMPIDNLTYYYKNSNTSNQLLSVKDDNNDPVTKLGDFRTSLLSPNQTKNASTVDYTYDVNGNLKKDLNKDIGTAATEDILYNHLNLPISVKVRTTGGVEKGTIVYTYDASGNKLQKITAEINATVPYNGSNYTSNITTTTNYISGFIYETKAYSNTSLVSLQYADKLQFTGHDEGRIRALYDNVTSPVTITGFAYDYFIKDHLGNVRMVLTDELKTDYYPASTLEGSTAGGALSMINYEKKFYTIDNTKIVNKPWTSPSYDYLNNNGITNPYPAGYTTNTGSTTLKVYLLNATTNTMPNKAGLGIVVKVMAGDNINIFGKSYHKKPNGGGYGSTTNNIIVSEIINSFAGTSIISAKGVAGSQITGQANFPSTMNDLITTKPPPEASRPKAAINWIVFDEQFHWVKGGFDMVGLAQNTNGTLKIHDPSTIPTISIPRNGYIYVYCSNESPNNVYFDNLQVVHIRGPLIEETHYYPFGLTMNGISSKALNFGSPENKKKWNAGSELESKEFSDGNGLEMYATPLRSLDPQLGRWWQIDPKPDYSQSLYSAMNNNPITFNDPLGDTVRHSFRTGFLGIFGKKVAVDYDNGKYYNKGTNAEYTGKTSGYQKSLLNDLTSLSNNSVTSSMMSNLVSNTKVVQIKNGASAETGYAQFEGENAIASPSKPLVVNYSVGKSYTMPDISQGGANPTIPGFVALAHEFAHVQDYLTNGSTNFLARNGWYTSVLAGRIIGRTEIFATDMENRLRANLRIALREFYIADRSKGITEGPILLPGTRTNANIGVINNGLDAAGNLIPVTY